MKTEKQLDEAKAAQKKFCEEKGYPHFAPEKGYCFSCRRNIYQDFARPGRTGNEHVTGCPHCNYSYCE